MARPSDSDGDAGQAAGRRADFNLALQALEAAVTEAIPGGRIFLLGLIEQAPIIGSQIRVSDSCRPGRGRDLAAAAAARSTSPGEALPVKGPCIWTACAMTSVRRLRRCCRSSMTGKRSTGLCRRASPRSSVSCTAPPICACVSSTRPRNSKARSRSSRSWGLVRVLGAVPGGACRRTSTGNTPSFKSMALDHGGKRCGYSRRAMVAALRKPGAPIDDRCLMIGTSDQFLCFGRLGPELDFSALPPFAADSARFYFLFSTSDAIDAIEWQLAEPSAPLSENPFAALLQCYRRGYYPFLFNGGRVVLFRFV